MTVAVEKWSRSLGESQRAGLVEPLVVCPSTPTLMQRRSVEIRRRTSLQFSCPCASPVCASAIQPDSSPPLCSLCPPVSAYLSVSFSRLAVSAAAGRRAIASTSALRATVTHAQVQSRRAHFDGQLTRPRRSSRRPAAQCLTRSRLQLALHSHAVLCMPLPCVRVRACSHHRLDGRAEGVPECGARLR